MVYARCKQATADQQGDAEAIALDLLAGLIFSERSVGTQILEEVLASSICFFWRNRIFFRFFSNSSFRSNTRELLQSCSLRS
jgi:hypothetical protein